MSTLQLLPIVKIRTERNVRDKVDDLGELTASIKAVGVLEPITVRPDGGDYVVMWGHRRLAAALIAGLTEIPAIVRVDLDVVNQASAQLIENLMRKDIAPLEEAGGYKRLIDLGLTQGGVAAKVGRSQAHVSKRLALLALPKKVREQVNSGGITIEAALEPKREKRAPKAKAVKPSATVVEVSRKVDELTTTFEVANRKVWILASPEVLAEIREGWSGPVQVHADENPDGSWEMTFRTYTEVLAVASPNAVETRPVGQPVSQHVCRVCGCHGDCAGGCVWTEMVEIGFLCSNCESTSVKPLVETAGPVDQRSRSRA